jgi:hypothetical protein
MSYRSANKRKKPRREFEPPNFGRLEFSNFQTSWLSARGLPFRPKTTRTGFDPVSLPAQCGLGVHILPARHIDQREEQVADLGGKLEIGLGLLDLFDLLPDLIQHTFDLGQSNPTRAARS